LNQIRLKFETTAIDSNFTINAHAAAPAADKRAKARLVNRVLQALRRGKGGIRGADTAS
jgi:hypothetical protein